MTLLFESTDFGGESVELWEVILVEGGMKKYETRFFHEGKQCYVVGPTTFEIASKTFSTGARTMMERWADTNVEAAA